jgi:hypothetical protein
MLLQSRSGSAMADTDWTFARIKARGLRLEGMCQTPGCGHFYTFDIDALIENGGPDHPLPEIIPGVVCEACGGELKSQLAHLHPDGNGEPG